MEIKYCDNWFEKLAGLMFAFGDSRALVFSFEKEKIVPLHMFFVFHPIDVVFLDSGKSVVETKIDFMPFAVYIPRNKAKYVIEVPQGYIKKNNISIGDIFSGFEVIKV